MDERSMLGLVLALVGLGESPTCLYVDNTYKSPPTEMFQNRWNIEVVKNFALIHMFTFGSLNGFMDQRHQSCSRPLIITYPTVSGTPETIIPKLRRGSILLIFYDTVDDFQINFEDINIRFDVQIFIARLRENEFEILKLHRESKNEISFYRSAVWSQSGIKVYKPMEREKLNGHFFRAVVNTNLTSNEIAADKTISYMSYYYRVWETLAEHLNFSYKYVPNNGTAWGTLRPDGSWDGLVGEVERGRAHAAVAPLSFTNQRSAVVDFLAPLRITKEAMFIRRFNKPDVKWKTFIQPFENEIWFMILLIVILCDLVIEYSVITTARLANGNFHVTRNRKMFGSEVYCLIGILCGQGDECKYSNDSIRLAHVFVHLTAIVLEAAYCGALIAFLAITKVYLPFDDLAGLSRDPTYALGVEAATGTLSTFQNSSNEVMRGIYARLLEPQLERLPDTVLEGFIRTCFWGKYAFITSLEDHISFASQIPCPVVQIRGASTPDTMSMILYKNSHQLPILNHWVSRMRSAGVLKRLFLSSWPHPEVSEEPPLSEVDLSEMTPTLAFLGAAYAVSVIFLFLERVCVRVCLPTTTIHKHLKNNKL